jgi:hypothetical protein
MNRITAAPINAPLHRPSRAAKNQIVAIATANTNIQ